MYKLTYINEMGEERELCFKSIKSLCKTMSNNFVRGGTIERDSVRVGSIHRKRRYGNVYVENLCGRNYLYNRKSNRLGYAKK